MKNTQVNKIKNYFKYKNTNREVKKRKANNFEKGVHDILKEETIHFEAEYQIPNTTKFYDIYLPDYNLLIELDGDYYHKDSILECINKMQIKNYKNDRYKDKLAFSRGYKLIRIKQSDNITSIKQLLNEKNYNPII